jgi:hypothetical protein
LAPTAAAAAAGTDTPAAPVNKFSSIFSGLKGAHKDEPKQPLEYK